MTLAKAGVWPARCWMRWQRCGRAPRPTYRRKLLEDPPSGRRGAPGGSCVQTHVPSPPAWRRLPPKLEREFVIAAEGGDADARARLVEAFLPAIGGVARVYRNSSA